MERKTKDGTEYITGTQFNFRTILCAHRWVEKYGNRGQKTMDAICTKCGKVDGYWNIKSQYL